MIKLKNAVGYIRINSNELSDVEFGIEEQKQAIDKKIPYGVYHTTNEGFTTWYLVILFFYLFSYQLFYWGIMFFHKN